MSTPQAALSQRLHKQPAAWIGRTSISLPCPLIYWLMPDLSPADLASPEVLARARKIKLFLMDVDGTLTDGGVCLISSTAADGSGAASVSEMKIFNAKDGQGLSLAHTMGIQTGFITGRRSPAVAKRAEELKVTFVYLGQAKKTQAFDECVEKAGVTKEEVAYMGDDLPDIPLAQRAGLAISVADGANELKAVCHYITRQLAGRGAAREVVELILKAQGRWEEAVPLALA
jgi:3-deoxy-D-manno-octulosonate 8-phosphate phosphatase (KDO 8-P phosphatase)